MTTNPNTTKLAGLPAQLQALNAHYRDHILHCDDDTMIDICDLANTLHADNLAKDEEIGRLRKIVDEQAEDEGLWFIPQYATEGYLQRALRKLHAAIEGKSPEDCALAALAQTKTDADAEGKL